MPLTVSNLPLSDTLSTGTMHHLTLSLPGQNRSIYQVLPFEFISKILVLSPGCDRKIDNNLVNYHLARSIHLREIYWSQLSRRSQEVDSTLLHASHTPGNYHFYLSVTSLLTVVDAFLPLILCCGHHVCILTLDLPLSTMPFLPYILEKTLNVEHINTHFRSKEQRQRFNSSASVATIPTFQHHASLKL